MFACPPGMQAVFPADQEDFPPVRQGTCFFSSLSGQTGPVRFRPAQESRRTPALPGSTVHAMVTHRPNPMIRNPGLTLVRWRPGSDAAPGRSGTDFGRPTSLGQTNGAVSPTLQPYSSSRSVCAFPVRTAVHSCRKHPRSSGYAARDGGPSHHPAAQVGPAVPVPHHRFRQALHEATASWLHRVPEAPAPPRGRLRLPGLRCHPHQGIRCRRHVRLAG